jgi:MFS family permease
MTASSESSDVRRADEYASTPVDESAASTAAASRNVDALTFDEMLALHVGENGRAQIRHFLISSAAWLPAAFLTLMTVFTARMPAWRCTTLDGCTDESSGELKDICELEATEWEWVSKTVSIVSEWNLVCDEEWKTSAADSIFFVGFFFGAGIIGQLADVHGRRVALYGSLLIAGGASVITGVSFGYWEYLLFKVVLGFGCGGIGVASFVLCTEPLGAPWRGFLGVATQYWWSSVSNFFFVMIPFFQTSKFD